jgi:transposase-like protein
MNIKTQFLKCPRCQSEDIGIYKTDGGGRKGICQDCDFESKDIEGDFVYAKNN